MREGNLSVQTGLEERPKEHRSSRRSNKPIGYARCKILLDETGTPSDAIFLETSPSFATYFQLEPNDLIGKSKFDTFAGFYAGKREKWLSKYSDVAFSNQSFSEVVSYQGNDYELSSYCPKEGEFIILFQDISARLSNSQMYFDILSQMSDAVFITDENGYFKFVCPNVDFIFKQSTSQIKELEQIDALIGSDYRDWISNHIHSDALLLKNMEKTIVDQDGATHNLLIDIKEVDLAGGKYLFVCRDATEKQKALKQVEAERKKLKTLINTIPDLVWMKDPEGRYLACNDEFERLYGAPESDIVGKRDCDFVPKETADFFRKHDIKAMNLGRPSSNEETLHYKSVEKIIDVETTKAPFYDSEGNIIGVLGIARDITERNLIQKKLANSKARMEQIINTVDGVIWEVDPSNFEFTFISERVEEILGYTPQEWMSSPTFWQDHVHPDDRDKVLTYCATQTEKGHSHHFEFRFKRGDGRYIWAKEYVHVVTDEFGKPTSMVGLTVDIDEQIKNREDLTKYKRFFDLAQDHFCLASTDGKFLELNRRFTETLGYDQKTLMEGDFLKFLHPEDIQPTVEEMTKLDTGDQAISFRNRYRTANGEYRFFEWNTRPHDGTYYAVARDVSEQVIADRALKKSESKLRTLFDTTSDGILTMDKNGIILDVNHGIVQTTGYKADELIGEFIGILDKEITGPNEYRKMAQSAKIGESEVVERIHTSKKGVPIPVEINRKKIRIGQETINFSIVRDISQRKAQELMLTEKNEQLAMAQRLSRLGSWKYKTQSEVLDWSDEIFRIFGEKPQSFEPTVDLYFSYVHPDDREFVDGQFKECSAAKKPFHVIHRVVTNGGDTKYVEENAFFEYDEEDNLINAQGTVQDITQEYIAQKELKLRDENLRKFFESVHIGIAKNAMSGEFLEINPEFERFTGYSRSELNKMSYWDLTPKNYEAEEKTQLEHLRSSGRYGPYHKHYKTKSGELVPVLLNGVLTQDALGNEFIWSVVQDKSADEKMKAQLVQDVERLKSVLRTGGLLAFDIDLATGQMKTIRKKHEIDAASFPVLEVETLEALLSSARPEHADLCQRRLRELSAGEIQHFNCDFQIKIKDQYCWYEGIMSVLELDEAGKPIKTFLTLRNINDEKMREVKEIISQEEDRLRVARDIHDSIGQMLVGTRLMLRTKREELHEDYDELDEMLDAMIKESRLIINNFGITVSQDSLKNTFENLAEKMTKIYPGEIIVEWHGEESIVDLKRANHFFRIYQEALSNSIKYSKSKQIRVIVRNYSLFFMDIIDFGIGFSEREVGNGFGTQNMQERAHEVNSNLTISSKIDAGTVVKLRPRK